MFALTLTFDEHFKGAHARRIDKPWLDRYQRLWAERKKTEQRQRTLRERARILGGAPANVPCKIKGNTFAFTGAILGWPRKSKLYPFVEKRGGHVATKAASMANANCLVQGEILGGRKSTQKLVKAHERKIPIITEEQFFKLAGVKP